ncbi:type I polyketide synthase [Nonomuraea sediminis]|uniref:type I polyketide synthase n=1 Tax=Nonomuraea sediminis TaxID=2835864 RepID=UPI001BDD428F|nr:type I polyketide synthase [Nonomuraea sediminis]
MRLLETPIAIIGVSCRLPGAGDPRAFWKLLHEGVSAVRDTPPPGRPPSGPGGYLDRVDGFDADFFQMAPREAAAADPQQRLMLELCWEALEDARIVPGRLRGSRTGVIMGAASDDYLAMTYGTAEAIGPHTLAGVQRAMIANRVSHVLGLRGPSLVVDAGQCSSLVAVHEACAKLRAGEADLVLVGGVNLILAPAGSLSVGRAGALSPGGRCFTFDARADGYVRGEGGVALVLKPLPAARADGDRVYCVIRASAVNNDGPADALTVPSRLAQEEVIREACLRACVQPAEVGYVELHGTGTPVGDPVEAAALGAVLGVARPDACPLPVGSVKTNIGHLEGGAGIAGLLKVVLSIHEGAIAPSLNFASPHPRIPLAELGLRIPLEPEPWDGGPRIAGVSSFGIGGTNCHVVLTQAPTTGPVPPATAPRVAPWLLSARSAAALRAQAAAVTSVTAADPGEVGWSLATTRTPFSYRAAVVGVTPEEYAEGLTAISRGEPGPQVVTGQAGGGGLGFLFPGQGSQYPGMGDALREAFPVYAETFDMIAAELEPLRSSTATGTRQVQAGLFAAGVALYRLLESWGIRPDWVAGHSIGEIAAAHVAGVLPLSDACRLVAARGTLMAGLSGDGLMVSVQASEADVLAVLPPDGPVSVAAVNGPRSSVISGSAAEVTALAERLAAMGMRTRRLATDRAFHSPHIDPIMDSLAATAAGLTFGDFDGVRMVSTLTGRVVSASELRDPRYWARQAREPVLYGAAVQALHEAGVRTFIELGPGAQLTTMGRMCLEDPAAAFLPTLRREDEERSVLRAVAGLWVNGREADWRAVFGPRRTVDLPTYPFQRQRYWMDDVQEPATELVRVGDDPVHLVRAHTAAVLGHRSPEDVDPSRSFHDLGLTSITAMELSAALSVALARDVPATAVFDHPTPLALAAHLADDGETQATDGRTGSTGGPLAIIGMGCRYPGGVRSAEGLWRLVMAGRDAISPFPQDRGWDIGRLYDPDPERPGTSYVRHGGFLDDVAGFDADFFGINPKEAEAIDPQQRLLLEVSWEALERARLDPTGLAGRPVGVFVGATAQEYGPRLQEAGPTGGYALTGTTASVASGRIAYCLGLTGPALTVDTACSSSLVAMHLAARSLRSGECDLALAGGVTVMSSPGMFVEFSRQRGLAPDGRCKPFAAAADGTSWAEGAGMLVLARLEDAQAAGHPILAVLRGTAVNQDGASNGLTAPSTRAQVRVIRDALADADLRPQDVDAVETHGTGTTLGDPIEARALIEAYGRHRDRPLWLGALKSNLGHTQAAAGVAGVIKMVEALRHAELPRSLNIDELTPHVEWGSVAPLREERPWEDDGRPRRCGVSSFGISGTNAHVILEQAPGTLEQPSGTAGEPARELVPLLVSAKTDAALREQAERLGELLEADPAPRASDLAHALVTTRSRFGHRAVVLADPERPDLTRETLGALATGRAAEHLIRGTAVQGKTVFVFPGQGAQWPGMGVELAETEPVFAERLRACADALAEHADWALMDVLRGAPGSPPLDRVDVVQPALFAIMVALAAVWESWGVRPDAVIGHSQGEIAAACVAGALTLEDAAAVVAIRSQVITELAGTGGMGSIALPVAEARLRLRDTGLHLAAVNGPASVVIGGDADEVADFLARAEADGLHARRINVDYASHTPRMAAIRDRLLARLDGITPRAASIPFRSTTRGVLLSGMELDAAYWYENLSSPVLFEDAVAELAATGHGLFVEAGPHPILTLAVSETLESRGSAGAAVGSLQRDRGGWPRLLAALAEAHAHGAPVDWDRLLPGRRVRPVDLPTYPFQHRRFWRNAPAGAGLSEAGLSEDRHPFLGARVELPDSDGVLLTGRISGAGWLAGHAVAGRVLLPGTGFLELAAHAAEVTGRAGIRELVLARPITLPERDGLRLRVTVADGRLSVHTQQEEGAWTLHATGTLDSGESADLAPSSPWPPSAADEIDVTGAYAVLAARGYEYGPAFQGLRRAFRRGEEVFAEVALPPQLAADGFAVHPALLDAALHAWLYARESGLVLPFAWRDVRVHAAGATRLRVRLAPVEGTGEVSLSATDDQGRPVLSVGGLTLRPAQAADRDSLFEVHWRPVDLPEPMPGERYAAVEISADSPAAAAREALELLRERLAGEEDGVRLVLVVRPGLAHAPVAGLVRSAHAENPGRFVVLETDAPLTDALLARVAASDEAHLRFDGTRLRVPRLSRLVDHEVLTPPPAGAWRLGLTAKGLIENLTIVPAEPEPLGPGMVRVAVRAAGLNFRDVVVTLGLLPGEEGLGLEGAGVVLDTGPGVRDLRPGDRVFGLLRDAFGPVAYADARTLVPIPDDWTFAMAASVPVAFLTAYLGLVDVTGLRRGERLVVHAAAGGVGMAAVQLARHLGAEVFCTAHPRKWEVLRGMGIDDTHLASSRTVEFADAFAGADVVLNSLAGEFVDASLRMLATSGRFAEMGKTDLRDPATVAAEHPGITYRPFNLPDVPPDRIREIFQELVPLFARGVLRPLPVTAHDLRQARTAFRDMSRSHHTGKIVLTVPRPLDPGGTVLITGGTGTLAAHVARHLVARHGVRHLLLAGRRGPTPATEKLSAELAGQGAQVRVEACDVADRTALDRLLSRIPPQRPLTAVVHAAGILDDGIVSSLTQERLDTVMRPKAVAAFHLHEATAGLDLSAFVLFSSAAGVLGEPGQANYAAANACLDELARYRHRQGLPSISIAWGLWAERSGMTGHLSEADLARIRRSGMAPLPTADALGLFDAALDLDEPCVVPMRLEAGAVPEIPPVLRELVRPAEMATGEPASVRGDRLLELICAEAAGALGHDGEALRPEENLKALGFDSLTAIQLRNRIAAATGLRPSAGLILRSPTPLAIYERLEAELSTPAALDGSSKRSGDAEAVRHT